MQTCEQCNDIICCVGSSSVHTCFTKQLSWQTLFYWYCLPVGTILALESFLFRRILWHPNQYLTWYCLCWYFWKKWTSGTVLTTLSIALDSVSVAAWEVLVWYIIDLVFIYLQVVSLFQVPISKKIVVCKTLVRRFSILE